MHHNGFNKIFTNHDLYKLLKTNTLAYNGKTLAKHWQNIANRNNALVTIGKSFVESYI